MTSEKISGKEDLWFLPLGGTGEIGMNLNLYSHKWKVVNGRLRSYL